MQESSLPFLKDVHYCKRCCIPATNEGVSFDEMGICTACRSSEQKIHIDWIKREKQLKEILDHHKEKSGDNYDCLVPISGGKDSTFQLYVLTQIYKMKPLACTFSHNWFSETGKYNLENSLEQFGVDHIMFTPNRNIVNKLARASLQKIGDSCWHCHSGVGAFPLQVAVKFKIPLIVYGESVCESSGRASYDEPHQINPRDYFTKVSAKVYPEEMVNDEITKKDLAPFQLPSYEEFDAAKIKMIHLGDYIFWDDERQMEFMRDHFAWREDNVEGTYKGYKSVECKMPGVHDYTKFLKRGFGRATDHVSFDVRAGLMTREEGLKLAKHYDSIRPEALDEYLKITGYTEEEFYKIMEEKRLDEIKSNFDVSVLKENKNLVSKDPKCNSSIRQDLYNQNLQNLKLYQEQGENLDSMDACSILKQILQKNVSLQEVVKHFADKIESQEKTIKAWVCLDIDRAIENVKRIDEKILRDDSVGILSGLPVGIKDIFNTKDFPTSMGSPIWKEFTPGNDARVVHYLRDQDAIFFGKTVTAEFAVHEPGETANPHNIDFSPGTSSSGSAAAIAAGMLPLSIGTQTAGSIIRPASYCGIYGMKPSFGTLPRTGMLKTTDTLDQVGFFGRSVADLKLMFDIMRVRGTDFPFIQSELENAANHTLKEQRWKVAFVKTHTWDEAASYAKQQFLDFVDRIGAQSNVEIHELNLPSIFSESHKIHEIIYCKTLSYYFSNEFHQKDFVSQVLVKMIEKGHQITKEEYFQALEDQHNLYLACDQIFKNIDIAFSLSTSQEAPKKYEQETKKDPSLIWSLCGLPVINAPVFKSPELGLPFGVQLFSKRYWDYKLFQFTSEIISNELLI